WVRRRNRLEQFVSLQQAGVHRRWQATHEKHRPQLRPMPVDPDAAERFFDDMLRYWQRFDDDFSAARRLTIWYEDLCQDTEFHSLAMQNFLGASLLPGLQPGTIKIGRPADELISNFAELRRHFSGSKYEPLFRPDE